MLKVHVTNTAGKITAKAYAFDDPAAPKDCENRNDWRTFEAAQAIAAALGDKYQAIDNGPYVSPRYDVIDLPQIGDEVSYTINGDYYPCGKIKSISAGPGYRKIVAGPDFGGKDRVFWRRTRPVNGRAAPIGGAWISDRVWSMVKGHIKKLNPEF